jgi:hypothetical protein
MGKAKKNRNVAAMAQNKPVRFDEQGNLVAVGGVPISDDTGKVTGDTPIENGRVMPSGRVITDTGNIIVSGVVIESDGNSQPKTIVGDKSSNGEKTIVKIKAVMSNKYITMLATEKRATIDDAGTTMFCGNQRAMAIAICIVAGKMLGCEFDAPQAKSLAAKILVHVFGYSLAKNDVLRNGEVAASGMQKYVKYATGDKSRHLQYGGTAYGKLGSKPGTGYYIDSGMAQKLFDKYAPSEGYTPTAK